MHALKSRFLTALLCLGLPSQVSAQILSSAEVETLQTLEDTIRTSMINGDYDRLIDTNSPAIIATMAEVTGVTPEDQRNTLIDTFENGADLFTVVEYDLDIENRSEGQTITGRRYALVPVVTVLDFVDRPTTRVESTVLMFQDDTNWYWNRIDNGLGLSMLHQTYVDLVIIDQVQTTLTELD